MDFRQLKREFANPSSDYRLAPFWFLNHDLTDDELRRQINEMHDKGVDGFILHARHGLLTPYMSQEWMDRMETCVKEAEKLRMKAYLYDEDNWPSGTVGGALIEQYPEFRMSGCGISHEFDVQGGRSLTARIDQEDGLIAIVAVPISNGTLQGLPSSAVSLAGCIHDEELIWEAPAEGNWRVMVFTRRVLKSGTFFGGYLDTLNPDAVAQFIDMTHEKYAERLSQHFGGVVPGIFTDEPALSYHPHNVVPWTDSLPSEFDMRHGYDITGALPALFADAGDDTAQLRCDFHDTTVHLYEQAYFKQIYDYCESVRLKSIGHVLYEGELYEMSRSQGDFFRTAKYMHYGGCDLLVGSTWPTDSAIFDLNNLVGPKLASSASHIQGKSRTMCEAFGVAGGWGVDLRMLKRWTDWQVALGVNLIQPHAFYYSIQGHRKWECPPGEFYQSTFWPYYKRFADYAARLCNIFSGSEHLADVVVVLPVRSLWAARGPGFNEETNRIVDVFTRITTALLRAGYDFEIVPEEELVENMDSLDLEHFVSGESFKALIMPTPDVLLDETIGFLNECVEDSVPIIFADSAPQQAVVRHSEDWNMSSDLANALPPMIAQSVEALAEAGPLTFESEDGEGEEPEVVLLEGVYKTPIEAVTKAISRLLGDSLNADVIVRPKDGGEPYVGDILHSHYGKGDIDFYLLANTSDTASYSTRVELDTFGIPSLWDVETGEVEQFVDYESMGDRLVLRLDFQPTQSYLIGVTSEDIVETPPKPARRGAARTIELAPEWNFQPLSGNALPICDWSLSVGQGAIEEVWAAAHNAYTAKFHCETRPANLRMLVDGLVIEKIWRRSMPYPVQIKLNGQEVGPFEEGSYLDHLMLEADISEAVKKGRNIIEILCPTTLSGTGALQNPMILIGDFGLVNKDNSWMISAAPKTAGAGSWAEQGFPFYSGIAAYTQTVELPSDARNVVLKMEKPADMAEIVVNGESITTLLWEPWEADISAQVKPGANEITIRIANSLENLLLRRPKPSGILGRVWIEVSA